MKRRCLPWKHRWVIGEPTGVGYWCNPLAQCEHHHRTCQRCGAESITPKREELLRELDALTQDAVTDSRLQEGIANLRDAVAFGSWTICSEEAQALLDEREALAEAIPIVTDGRFDLDQALEFFRYWKAANAE